MFQPLEAVFARRIDYGQNWYKETELWPDDPQPLADVASQLIELNQQGAPILNPVSQLASWGAYFKDPIHGIGGQLGGDNLDDSQQRPPCRIGHTHLYLGANGDIRLCADFPSIGNIATDSIPQVWSSDQAEQMRDSIAQCGRPCTKSCLLDRGLKETVSSFVRLTRRNPS